MFQNAKKIHELLEDGYGISYAERHILRDNTSTVTAIFIKKCYMCKKSKFLNCCTLSCENNNDGKCTREHKICCDIPQTECENYIEEDCHKSSILEFPYDKQEINAINDLLKQYKEPQMDF